MLSECKRSKNANFSACIVPFNIGGGVFFGIAVFLRHVKCILKAHIILYHFGEDKVCGAVKNACNAHNIIGCKAL